MSSARGRQNERSQYERLKQSGICVTCKTALATSGVRCEACTMRARRTEAKRRADALASGLCTYCKADAPEAGGVMCAGCREYKRDKHKTRVMSGACGWCGRACAENRSCCPRCQRKHRANARRYRKRKKVKARAVARVERHTCQGCGGPKSDSGQACKECHLRTNCVSVISALLANPWSTVRDLALAVSVSERGAYRALAKIRAGGGEVDVKYEGVARGSVARYRLAKPPTWYRP